MRAPLPDNYLVRMFRRMQSQTTPIVEFNHEEIGRVSVTPRTAWSLWSALKNSRICATNTAFYREEKMDSPDDILKRPYSRVLIPEKKGFSARILEFPGCFAEGETTWEAYANLEKVALSWIAAAQAQNTPIPEPRDAHPDDFDTCMEDTLLQKQKVEEEEDDRPQEVIKLWGVVRDIIAAAGGDPKFLDGDSRLVDLAGVRLHMLVESERNDAVQGYIRRQVSKLRAGPTGEFPCDKLNEEDEGGLNVSMTIENNTVLLMFGKSVTWIGLRIQEVNALIASLQKAAEQLNGK